VPSSSNPSCDHANIIEENPRLNAKLAKGLATCIQGEKNLNDLLSSQRMIKGKEGLGFVVEFSKRRRKARRKTSLLLLPLLMFLLTFIIQKRNGGAQGKEEESLGPWS
jgi:hypothetical protein